MKGDFPLFLRQLLRRPSQISALAPSSMRLARKMAAQVPPGPGPVVEFGPGTGKITDALLEAGIAPADLTLYEMAPEFCTYLVQRYPGVDIRNAPAQTLRDSTLPPLRAVVSGLPLLSIPPAIQHDILQAAFAKLAPGAPFIQFTYGPCPPIPIALRQELGLRTSRAGWVIDNLPPAQVYVFHRIPH